MPSCWIVQKPAKPRRNGEWTQIGDIPADDLGVAPDGSIWIAGAGTLDHYDGTTWTAHAPDIAWDETFMAVAPDGAVWFGGDSTLDHYDGTTWTSHAPGGGFTPNGMTVAPDGRVWMESRGDIGAEDGFGLARYEGETWIAYPIPAYGDAAFAPDGSVWVADFYSGAFRFDGQQWFQYTEEHGLPTNSLEKLAEYDGHEFARKELKALDESTENTRKRRVRGSVGSADESVARLAGPLVHELVGVVECDGSVQPTPTTRNLPATSRAGA